MEGYRARSKAYTAIANFRSGEAVRAHVLRLVVEYNLIELAQLAPDDPRSVDVLEVGIALKGTAVEEFIKKRSTRPPAP